MSGHTPEPWVIYRHARTGIEGRDGRGVCSTGGYSDNYSDGAYAVENEANAERIVACWNALEGLDPAGVADVVAALEEARLQLEYMDGRSPSGTTPAVLVRVTAALARIRGEG